MEWKRTVRIREYPEIPGGTTCHRTQDGILGLPTYLRQSIRRPVLNHCENLRNCEISEQEIKDLPPELHADVAEQCMEGGQ